MVSPISANHWPVGLDTAGFDSDTRCPMASGEGTDTMAQRSATSGLGRGPGQSPCIRSEANA